MKDTEADLFVIGGGSGGVRAARVAAGHGAKVILAEEDRIGGTCVIRGCIPKKLMVYASHVSHEIQDAAGYGWSIPSPHFDWASLTANIAAEVSRLESIYSTNLANADVSVIRKRAVLDGGNAVTLSDGKKIRAGKILIAVGALPYSGPQIRGIEHVKSSNDIFNLEKQPERILIQGGGYIALEFACIFAGLGTAVTLVVRAGEILRGFDAEVRAHLHAEMEKGGISILTGRTVSAIEKRDNAYVSRLSDGSSCVTDEVMFAVGRRPNVYRLGLEKAGVAMDDTRGGIAVDAYSQTSAPGIYAVGDATNRFNLTPVAIREGHAFADTVFGNATTRVDHTNVPTAVFTQPEVGVVGLTEEQAKLCYPMVDVYKTEFRPMKATLSRRDTRTLMKMLVDAESGRVIGCHIVGPEAGEMVQLVAIAIKMNATKTDFDATMAVHPTAAEELVTLRRPVAQFRRTDGTGGPA